MKENSLIPLNDVLAWNLEKQPHAAITGKTGAGKTQFIYYLLLEAAKMTSEIYVLDGKGGDLSNLTSVHVAQSTEEVVNVFKLLVTKMHDRISAIKSKNLGNVTAVDIGFDPIFCFIDELAAIMINAKKGDRKNKIANRANAKIKSWSKLKEDSTQEILDAITELILVARQSSIHLVISAQHFDAKLLDDSTVRSNLSMKVLLGRQTPQEYNMMNLVAEQLPLVDFSVVGSGIIMLDGLGWVHARPFETPFITFNGCTPNEVLTDRIKNDSPPTN
ncbi:FtsK/SpoIIIE domain-containing protein [Levilactobacillus spicheri]|uniref:FtsK domain-containing protein n=2 Tax=Levilactobacillus spicheri TaxID=216463 RepID=A0ABQ0WSM9_9LACO|nr:FtsK/SpoIIIE domain-containing protein [Levilactobacillus spicheri]KRL50138.1 hypothetical protein FD37_GL002269 [Levilactobacillus spicheri DSM 15429]GEO65751.1 hypothetical protein LSP04_01700 [Levilactobacillus spicheri]